MKGLRRDLEGEGPAPPGREVSRVARPGLSAADSFSSGNYVEAARSGETSAWQTWAALGLVGRTGPALEGLARFADPEARFYEGVALWIDGQDQAAEKALEKLEAPHARALLDLVRQERIEVLAQLSWSRTGPQDLLSGARSDPKFRVLNLSFHPDDLPNRPYLDLGALLEEIPRPDFFVCQMLEWHLVPPDLHRLPCPVLGQTSDFDLHIQALHPWMQGFDEYVVGGTSEWSVLRRLVGVPVHAYPKCFGIPLGFSRPQAASPLVDVSATGTLLHPYQPDKARLVCEILGMDGVQASLLNGFLSGPDYNRLQAATTASLAYCRWPAGSHTQAIEALAMGCPLAQPEGSTLFLYLGEEEGTVAYSDEPGALARALRRLLEEPEEFRRRAGRGAEVVRREFDMARVASQHLRFLTWLAAKPRPARRQPAPAPLVQKRMFFFKGWVQGRAAERALLAANLERLPADGELHQRLDRARELVLEAASRWAEPPPGLRRLVSRAVRLRRAGACLPYSLVWALAGSRRPGFLPARRELEAELREEVSGTEALVAEALQIYRSTVEGWPDSLVARFNLVRAAWLLGHEGDRLEAARLVDQTLSRPPGEWRCDPLEDVFPYDFLPTHFNYRAYFDGVTEELAGGPPFEEGRVRLVLASLHHGRARDLGDLGEACRLDPAFPYYRLSLARALAREGRVDEAAAVARPLALDSMLLLEAGELLRRLGRLDPEVEKFQKAARRGLVVLERYPPRAIPSLRPLDQLPFGVRDWFLEAGKLALRRSLQPLLSRLLGLRTYLRSLQFLQEGPSY